MVVGLKYIYIWLKLLLKLLLNKKQFNSVWLKLFLKIKWLKRTCNNFTTYIKSMWLLIHKKSSKKI
jgi:hypothetical protein